MYRKQGSFPFGPDLCCGNLAGVHKWVKQVMIDSGCTDIAIDFKPLRRGNALGGAAEASHHKKQRYMKDENDRLILQAKELELSNMKNFEMQYTSVIKFARSTAKAWFKDESSSDRHNAFASTLDKIRKNALALERRQNKSDGKSFPRLVEELQRLRILSDTHVSLQVLDSCNAYSIIDEVEKNCSNKAIVALCTQLKEQWKALLRKHLIVGAAPWHKYPLHFPSSIPTSKRRGGHGVRNPNDYKVGGKRMGGFSGMNTPKKSMRISAVPARPNSHGKGSTGIGKGRKICHHCNQIVGSPSRICPFCKGELPLKTTPKDSSK
mmetsp:Transcript_2547/g.4164  ORF Transcript_2547/g.4164 Transcript_2547/m.4164 type:complete len:322 (+) Transcript_2547:136-1101(+)